MPLDQTMLDEKQNVVVVTLFETHLAKFVLEHADVYQAVYVKLIDSIIALTITDPQKNKTLQAFLRNKPVGYDLSRYMYTVFSRVNASYPGHDSFETLKSKFNILACDYFLKIIADELLNMDKIKALEMYNYIFNEAYAHLDYDTLNSNVYKNFNKLEILEK